MAFTPTEKEKSEALWYVARYLQAEVKRLVRERNAANQSSVQIQCMREEAKRKKWINALCALYKERTTRELRVFDVK